MHACWTERYLSLWVVPSWDFAPLHDTGHLLQHSPVSCTLPPFSICERESWGWPQQDVEKPPCGCSSSLISVQLISQPLQLSSFGLWVFITCPCLKSEASLRACRHSLLPPPMIRQPVTASTLLCSQPAAAVGGPLGVEPCIKWFSRETEDTKKNLGADGHPRSQLRGHGTGVDFLASGTNLYSLLPCLSPGSPCN